MRQPTFDGLEHDPHDQHQHQTDRPTQATGEHEGSDQSAGCRVCMQRQRCLGPLGLERGYFDALGWDGIAHSADERVPGER